MKILLEDIKFKKRNIAPVINIPTIKAETPHPKENIYHKDDLEVVDVPIIKTNIKPSKPKRKNKRDNKKIYKSLLTIFIVTLFLGGVYLCLNIFQKTTINIKSKHQLFTLEGRQFNALKDIKLSSSNTPVQFEIMIVPGEESKDIILTNSKNVAQRAQGTITLYNTYSVKPEKLPIHTFVSDINGKTYLTDNAVSIPGYKKINNKTIPGQIMVNITAFLPGESYNGSSSDFTVNAFKNTAKYKNIFGKLQTQLTGGAQGQVYFINDIIRNNLDTIANSTFKNNLLKKVKAEVPAGYILYPNATQFTYKIDDTLLYKTPNVNIQINGEISTILLKQSDLSNALLKSLLPDISTYESSEISFKDISNLSFDFIPTNQLITKDVNSIAFTLTGQTEAVWQPDINLLKTNIIGISKNTIPSIFTKDPGISEASVKLFPPWQTYLPMNPSKIDIIVK